MSPCIRGKQRTRQRQDAYHPCIKSKQFSRLHSLSEHPGQRQTAQNAALAINHVRIRGLQASKLEQHCLGAHGIWAVALGVLYVVVQAFHQ